MDRWMDQQLKVSGRSCVAPTQEPMISVPRLYPGSKCLQNSQPSEIEVRSGPGQVWISLDITDIYLASAIMLAGVLGH